MNLFPDTITVFNMFSTETKKLWLPTVVKCASFELDENTIRNRVGLANADTVNCYVNKPARSDNVYVSPYDYALMELEVAKKHFTFRKGDMIAKGVVDIGEMSINEFKNRYGNLYVITGVSDFDFGRVSHYLICAK